MLSIKKYSKNVLLASLMLLFLASCTQSSSNVIEAGVKAPEFELLSSDDQQVKLSDYKGKYLVVHIATTWCPYCNAEMPYLEELYSDYKDKNVEALVIDVKESKELVNEKLKERFNMQIPVLLDLDGNVAGSFAPEDVLPDLARDEVMLASNLVIDPDGNIIYMSLLDTKNFDTELVEIKRLLDEVL